MPLISVIVPVYNVEKHLKRCINSILSQTQADFELILIDDGSTDKSGVICDEFATLDKRIQVFHKENGGAATARNFGFNKAKGKWIQFYDSDDWISPNALQLMYEKAIETKSEMVFCDFLMVWSDGNKRINATDWSENKIKSLEKYIGSVWTCMWMILAKRSLYTANNLQSPTNITFCEDFHLSVRLAYYAKKVSVVHQPLYYYNQENNNSIMASINRGERISKIQKEEIAVYLDIIHFFQTHNNYQNYERAMSWRVLKAKQFWVLKKETWNEYLTLLPESKKYIWSCPFINRKLKIMSWCLTHNLRWITNVIIYMRKVLGR